MNNSSNFDHSAYNKLNVLLTNARSISPKIDSLILYMEELDATLSIITESWLRSGSKLEDDLFHLEHGTNLKMIYRNRDRNGRAVKRDSGGKIRGGGVAIIYHKNKINLTELKMPASRFEIVAAIGNLPGHTRKLVVYAVYAPPSLRTGAFDELIDEMVTSINKIKTEYDNPIIIVGGDFNRKPIDKISTVFPDIVQLDSPPTRDGALLDMIFTNIAPSFLETKIGEPLYSPDGRTSDHAVIYSGAVVSKKDKTSWKSYKARKRTACGIKRFHELLAAELWADMSPDLSPTQLTAILEDRLTAFMDECFPVKTFRVRENDDPWITHGIRAKIAHRREVFWEDGFRSDRWKCLKKETDSEI